ncbi:unnamed protein product [Camellia sinensis]
MFYSYNVQVKVRDGRSTNFWKDKWCNNLCLKDEFPILFRLVLEKNETLRSMYDRKVASGDWNFNLRRRLFEWEDREVSRLKVMLQSVTGLGDDQEDNVSWLAGGSGQFSVSSAYQSEVVSLDPLLSTWKLVWNKLAPPKVQFFCWLAWKNRAKTADFLQKIGVLQANVPALCVFCKVENETLCHVLLHYNFVWKVWAAMLNWWKIQGALPGSVEAALHWWDWHNLNKKEKMLWKVTPLAIFWSLWKARNECIFQSITPKLEDLCDLIKIRVALWLNHKFKDFHFTIHDYLFNFRQIRGSLESTLVLGCC